jgi:alpha-tubulin suppressor-like RCC1 family protein
MDASLGARRGLRYHAAGDVTLFGLAAAAPFRASRRQGGKARRERGESQSTVTTAVRGHQREDQGCPQGAASRIQALGALAGNKIAAMAAGPEHAFVCFADKTILSTGSNFFGQLGTGSDGLSQKAFAPLELRHPIVSVSCGRAHTIMATLYGEVYACGSNTSGQLGLGDFEDRLVLTRSDLSQWTVISVAAGENHTLAVTKRGQLYSFGSNSEGQLGISRPQDQANRTFCNRTDDLTSKAKPTLIQFEPELAASRRPLAFEVLQMCCGARHCMAIVRTWRMDTQEVISERDLFSWGSNRHGQLGKSRVCEYQGTPRWVKIHPAQQRKQLPDDFADPPAKAREGDPSSMLWYDSSGESQGSDLDAASATSSQWEWGGYGEVPVAGGKNKKSSGFQKLNASAIRHEEMISVRKAPRRVSCGAEFTLIVTADSSVYACGCCDKGQLGVRGMKDRDEPSLVSALHGKAVTDVACGREHAFALVKVSMSAFDSRNPQSFR